MQVVVFLKQVPDTTNVRIDPVTNTLVRDGVASILNPFDAYALEQALRLKDRLGATVTAISMGPPQAKTVLREALARGADRAFLVSSRAFGGADTLATAYTLARVAEAVCAKPDLVLFGKQAIDGDTAQVGPGVSEFLGLPLVTYVRELEVRVEESKSGGEDGGGTNSARRPGLQTSTVFTATTLMDDGEHVIEGTLPAVMTVVKEADEPRFASLAGTMAAAKTAITVLDEKALAADPVRIGLKGSPTKVVSIFPPPVRKGGRKVTWTGDAHGLAETIREVIRG